MKAIIGVIDFGMGNIQSVINGFEAIGKKVVKVDSPSSLSKLDGIVLPGVGAFAQGMKNLKKLGFDDDQLNELCRKLRMNHSTEKKEVDKFYSLPLKERVTLVISKIENNIMNRR